MGRLTGDVVFANIFWLTQLHPWTTADMSKEERDEWLMQTDPDVQYGDPLDATEEEMRGAVTIVVCACSSTAE